MLLQLLLRHCASRLVARILVYIRDEDGLRERGLGVKP
jgi:hypothetical protein